ncbi:MAG: chemotaxis protein CheX [Acidobacteriaceae bacterium]|jgi:chemotaxis protein CheX
MVTLTETERKLGELAAHLDRAVEEVFGTMLGVECRPAHEGPEAEAGTISAVIGLAGALSGSLVLQSGEATARRMAACMTGAGPDEVDAMVRDAIGEIANMLAGAWKGFDPELSCGCLLSTPTVVAGTNYQLFSQRAPMRLERSYHFEEKRFTVSVFCDWSR